VLEVDEAGAEPELLMGAPALLEAGRALHRLLQALPVQAFVIFYYVLY
jgi:hypothetical protein